jgi:hypothetical protein
VVLPLWGCCLCCCGHGEFEDVHSHGIESDRMERKADGALYPVQLDVLLVYYIESTPLELIRSPAMRVVVLALSSSLRPLWLPCTLSWVSTDRATITSPHIKNGGVLVGSPLAVFCLAALLSP